MSVMNPGITNRSPPTKTHTPSINALPGVSIVAILFVNSVQALIPCRLARNAPPIPVIRIIAIVGSKPIVFPE